MTSGDAEHDDLEHRPDLGLDANRGIDPELDYEAAFAALVAQFSAPDAEPVRAQTRLADQQPPPAVTEETPERLYPAELDEHFEPPDPPPLPRGDIYSRLAWAGVIGGPLFLLIAAIVGGALPSMLIATALVAFVGGFVTLVARMPGERSDDEDDGAVV
jgi:hypothetical protein